MKVLLETRNLDTGYAAKKSRRVVSAGLDLSVSEGELVCLVGPNGVGKSTLLRTLTGLQPPLDGFISFNGRPLQDFSANERSQSIGVVLTERLQMGMMDARSLVSLGRYPFTGWLGTLSMQDDLIVENVMRKIGIEHVANRSVATLSDGERQKVMIARALAQEPRLVVLDEPTAFLDYPRRVEIMQLLRELAHQADHAVILSTHDLDLAITTADILWLMNTDGRVLVGAPEDLILEGAFDSVFNQERIRYSINRGKFIMHREYVHSISLEASGRRLKMARHAMERIGFSSESGTADGTGLILKDTGDGWILRDAGKEQRFDTLYGAGRALRQRQKALSETENP